MKPCSAASGAGRDSRDGSIRPSHPRVQHPADLEDTCLDDGGAGARYLRRRSARVRRAERCRHPAAAHVHDGSDVGHRHAVLHLLGRAVRWRNHLDPVQYSGRSLVGGHDIRRLSDGAARKGRGGADRRIYLVLHRLAFCRSAHHLSLRRELRLSRCVSGHRNSSPSIFSLSARSSAWAAKQNI